MNRSKGVLLRAALATAVALGLAACSGGGEPAPDSGPTTLRVWDQFTDASTKAAAAKVYADFEAANPDVKIEVESYRYEDMGQLAKTALASGTGPDVLYFDAGQGEAGLLARSDLILPLTDYDKQYKWSERLSQEILKWTTYDGTLFGLGLESEVAGLFSNNTLFEKAGLTVPTTYDELLTFCGAAADKGYVPIAYGQGPAILAKDAYAMVANNLVGPQGVADVIFSEEGGWDSPEMVKALDIWFAQMADARCFPKGVNGLSVENAFGQFTNQKALMLAGGSFWVPELKDALPDEDLSLLPFVEVTGGPGRYYPAGIGSAWIISSQAKAPDVAAKFIDFHFSEKSVQTWMETGGLVPPVQTDLSTLDLSPLERSTAELIQTGTDASGNDLGFYIWPVWSATLNSDFIDGAQAITDKQKTASEFGAEMQTQWEKDKADT